MPSTQTLAQLSDNLVYSAIAVYVLAMLAYAALSARRTVRVSKAKSVPAERAGAVLSGGSSAVSSGMSPPAAVLRSSRLMRWQPGQPGTGSRQSRPP